MVELPILIAAHGAGWEAEVVSQAAAAQVRVVRRCVDLTDLLATAGTGLAAAVLLGSELPRLDRQALARLAASRVSVVGVASGESGEQQLRRLGVAAVVLAADSDAAAILAAVRSAAAEQPPAGEHPRHASSDVPGAEVGVGDPRWALPLPPAVTPVPAGEVGSGRVVAVWGPAGAPGRTTLALGLADELGRLGVGALLVDADCYGGAVAQLLGLLDESAGLAAAAQLDNRGELDVPALARLSLAISPALRVLTGLTRPDRWPELRFEAVTAVLGRARAMVPITVVDTGFSLEEDEELSFDTAAPRRNAATLAALETADEVLVVGSGDPVGVHRLVRGLTELRARLPEARVRVVINRLRSGAVPGNARGEIVTALRRFAGVEVERMLPYDRKAADAAACAGRTLAEVAPSSALRKEIAALAGLLAPGAGPSIPARARGRDRMRSTR